MSYNVLNLPDGTIKGYQGLGFGGVQPTTTAGTVGVDNTAPYDGLCLCFNRGVGCSHMVSVNGKDLFTLGGDSVPNMYNQILFPVVKGAIVKVRSIQGTVYQEGMIFISY